MHKSESCFQNEKKCQEEESHHPLVTGLITGVPFHHVSVSISFPDRPSITFGRLIVAVQLTNEQETIVLTKGKESSLQTSTRY